MILRGLAKCIVFFLCAILPLSLTANTLAADTAKVSIGQVVGDLAFEEVTPPKSPAL